MHKYTIEHWIDGDWGASMRLEILPSDDVEIHIDDGGSQASINLSPEKLEELVNFFKQIDQSK